MKAMQAESSCNENSTGDTTWLYTKRKNMWLFKPLFQVRISPGREKCDSHNPEINIDQKHHVEIKVGKLGQFKVEWKIFKIFIERRCDERNSYKALQEFWKITPPL